MLKSACSLVKKETSSSVKHTGQTWIPKDEDEKLLKFKGVLPELTTTGNGIILKGERIVLPEKLQTLAITLAHRGSHP